MFKQIILLSAFFLILNATYDGIDVSVWQGANVDFKKVKKDGKDFVIIRAGYGHGSVDKYFETNYKKAKEAGLNVGAYWYAKALDVDQSTKEAKLFMKTIKGKKFEYPLYYDVEDKHIFKKGKEMTSKIADNFCKILEKNNYYCGIYASTAYLQDYFTSEVLKKYTIWVAQYYKTCTFKGKYQIWQKSSKGKVAGISGNVDLDISYEDFPSVIKSKKLNGY